MHNKPRGAGEASHAATWRAAADLAVNAERERQAAEGRGNVPWSEALEAAIDRQADDALPHVI